MSWLFSQALVEEYLGENSLDGEQSVPLSGNPIQLAYLPPDKMTAFSRVSRFGMTYKPLTESRGKELLMLYLAGFHAKTSQQPERAQESTENDQECGEKWRGSFTKYDPDSSLWRTHQCSFLGDLEPFSETWPQWGLMRNGECWEQRMLEQTIRGTESGLSGKMWLTPRVVEIDETPENFRRRMNSKRKNDRKDGFGSLTMQVKALLPTPTCHNSKEGAYPSEYTRKTPTLATHAGGKLNPDWVEWLMNWPIKWSDLNGFDAKECKRWQEASSTPLQESVQMRTVWWDRDPSEASHRPQHEQQQEQQYCDSLQQMSRGASCESTLERSHEGQDLPILRDSVHLQTTERESLQSGVWEQVSMDETQIVPRVGGTGIAVVDRLKAIGNGQVPLCAATAWKVLI